jgi:hypothetical protein
LSAWLEAAQIADGPLVRWVHHARPAQTALNVSSVQKLVKRAAKRAGGSYQVFKGFSCLSMRICVAQDMMVASFDSLALIQAGGWKTQHVPLRYFENTSKRSMYGRRRKALVVGQSEARFPLH